MSTTHELITALKQELKSAQVTYAQLAQMLGMAESSVKRMFSKGDMTLSRIDDICKVLQVDFADLARRIAEAQPELSQLTPEQEKAVVSDKKLLVAAICVLSQWTFEQIVSRYRISEPECVKYFAQLDRLGIIELRPQNRYRLKLGKTFRWQPNGPVMNFFRDHALLDYFSGNFAREDELITLVFGSISPTAAPALLERLRKVARDFAQQHQADHKLPERDRKGYTIVMAMRGWEVEALKNLNR
ncbi:helix-turn-helix domain-containing protein [Saezia sanguinis]|jgi:DNA-binding Xre family transcriptional regulator|uniref:helix-turn-helix domain-containing protein n=1 Tax=Saezia sanguinis TaxID=1965230 RepID=UPI00306BDD0F